MSTAIAYERVPATELWVGDAIILGNSASADHPAVPCVVTGVTAVCGGVSIVTGNDIDYLPADRLVTRLFAVERPLAGNRFSVAVCDEHGRDDVAFFPDLDSAMAYTRQPAQQSTPGNTVSVNVEGLMS